MKVDVCTYCPWKSYRDKINTILWFSLSHWGCEYCNCEFNNLNELPNGWYYWKNK